MSDNFSTPIGQHVLLDLYQCNEDLSNTSLIQEIMVEAANQAGATIVDERFHTFSPQGVSGMVIIKESHLSIHTWPEHCFASVDIYTCGEVLNFEKAIAWLKKSLGTDNCVQKHFERGNYIINERIKTL